MNDIDERIDNIPFDLFKKTIINPTKELAKLFIEKKEDFRIVFLGLGGVGKSSLISNYFNVLPKKSDMSSFNITYRDMPFEKFIENEKLKKKKVAFFDMPSAPYHSNHVFNVLNEFINSQSLGKILLVFTVAYGFIFGRNTTDVTLSLNKTENGNRFDENYLQENMHRELENLKMVLGNIVSYEKIDGALIVINKIDLIRGHYPNDYVERLENMYGDSSEYKNTLLKVVPNSKTKTIITCANANFLPIDIRFENFSISHLDNVEISVMKQNFTNTISEILN